jgi:predicted DNA binding protein
MTDVLAVFRVEHPDLGLTKTAEYDPTASLRPFRDAGTDPESDRYLYSVSSEDFDQFEAGLGADPTIERFERVMQLDGDAIYSISYSESAVLFSTEIGRHNGAIMNMWKDGTAWLFKTWFPDRAAAQRVWEYAVDHDVEIELDRINEYGSIVENEYGLTDKQREAILVALGAGYFDEPRGATLGEVAATLDISQPAASGLLRRGIKRLALATVAEEEDES